MAFRSFVSTVVFLLSVVFTSQFVNAADSQQLPILDYENLDQYSGKDLYQYHKQLIILMGQMESIPHVLKVPGKARAILFRWIEESYAEAGTESMPPYEIGNNCLIGGYFGNFRSRSGTGTSDITCDSPQRCTTSGGGSGHICNPKFFTYANPVAGTTFCAKMTRDLTTTGCLPAFDAMYEKMCGKSDDYCPAFAEHFKKSVKKATGKDSPRALRKYVQEIFAEYKRIEDYCYKLPKETNKEHTLGQKESCFKLKAQYEKLMEIYNRNRPTDFSCITDGLKNAGYANPSEKQLSVIAARSKVFVDTNWARRFWGPYIRGQDSIKTTILGLSSVGVCENVPLTAKQKEYTGKLLGTAKVKDFNAQEFADVYGTSPSFMPDEGWLHQSFDQRAKRWYSDKPYVGSDLRTCTTQPDKKKSISDCKAMAKSCGFSSEMCEAIVREHDSKPGKPGEPEPPGPDEGETPNGENTAPDGDGDSAGESPKSNDE